LAEIKCEKKSQFSDVVEKDRVYKLTTDSFGPIPIANINKLKLYANKIPQKIVLKIEEDDEDKPYIFYIKKPDIRHLFSRLLWVRLATMNIFTDLDANFDLELSGEVIQSIEHFGKWEKKHATISREGGLKLTSKEKGSRAIKIERFS
jgi:hypothetical protein